MSIDAVIHFGYSTDYSNGNVSHNGSVSVRGERTQYLPTVLDAMVTFLQAAGYTYVTELVAVAASGDEFTSNDASALEADGLFDDEEDDE